MSTSTTSERLAFQQSQRYWVEQALRNAKSEVGMADYQLRLWQGWHHHMAMVMLAMLFMFEVRREHREDLSLLSCHDVVEVLRVLLPRANVTYEDILRQLKERHRRRQAAIDSAYEKQLRKQQYSGPCGRGQKNIRPTPHSSLQMPPIVARGKPHAESKLLRYKRRATHVFLDALQVRTRAQGVNGTFLTISFTLLDYLLIWRVKTLTRAKLQSDKVDVDWG